MPPKRGISGLYYREGVLWQMQDTLERFYFSAGLEITHCTTRWDGRGDGGRVGFLMDGCSWNATRSDVKVHNDVILKGRSRHSFWFLWAQVPKSVIAIRTSVYTLCFRVQWDWCQTLNRTTSQSEIIPSVIYLMLLVEQIVFKQSTRPTANYKWLKEVICTAVY